MLTVERLMKGPVTTTHARASVRDALAAMAEAGVRHLPVVDKSGKLIGMVSQLDLARAIDRDRVGEGARGDTHVGDVMSAPVFRATRQMAAHDAAGLMIEQKIGALPVVDAEGRVLGIVSEADFLEVARESLLGVDPESRAHA
jgi:CBS domain-containing protein